MIKYYLSDIDGTFNEINGIQHNCWINMTNPTEDEIRTLSTNLEIPLDFIFDALDNDETSRIERDEDKVLIIVDFPVISYDEFETSTFETIPIGMIITENHFITVCLRESYVLSDFINQRVKEFYTFKKSRFALQILNNIAISYLRYLKQLNRKTDEIEKQLHESVKNQHLFELMNIEKSLVYFLTSLKANKIILDKMARQRILRMYEDDQDLLEDVVIEKKQAIEMAEVHSNILSGMMDAYASIISNNMNTIMKFLTSFTIVLSLPTMVFSFYGMNVDLPFDNVNLAWIKVSPLSRHVFKKLSVS